MIRWRGYHRNPDGTLTRIVEDEGPSEARLPGHRGSLVLGGPGPNDKDVHNRQTRASKALTRNQAKLDARPVGKGGRPRIYTEDEAIAARRKSWRESKARKKSA